MSAVLLFQGEITMEGGAGDIEGSADFIQADRLVLIHCLRQSGAVRKGIDQKEDKGRSIRSKGQGEVGGRKAITSDNPKVKPPSNRMIFTK